MNRNESIDPNKGRTVVPEAYCTGRYTSGILDSKCNRCCRHRKFRKLMDYGGMDRMVPYMVPPRGKKACKYRQPYVPGPNIFQNTENNQTQQSNGDKGS